MEARYIWYTLHLFSEWRWWRRRDQAKCSGTLSFFTLSYLSFYSIWHSWLCGKQGLPSTGLESWCGPNDTTWVSSRFRMWRITTVNCFCWYSQSCVSWSQCWSISRRRLWPEYSMCNFQLMRSLKSQLRAMSRICFKKMKILGSSSRSKLLLKGSLWRLVWTTRSF